MRREPGPLLPGSTSQNLCSLSTRSTAGFHSLNLKTGEKDLSSPLSPLRPLPPLHKGIWREKLKSSVNDLGLSQESGKGDTSCYGHHLNIDQGLQCLILYCYQVSLNSQQSSVLVHFSFLSKQGQRGSCWGTGGRISSPSSYISRRFVPPLFPFPWPAPSRWYGFRRPPETKQSFSKSIRNPLFRAAAPTSSPFPLP